MGNTLVTFVLSHHHGANAALGGVLADGYATCTDHRHAAERLAWRIIVVIHLYAMTFHITPSASTPIYRQIVEQVRRLIASGQLRPGDELPSVRTVALKYAINPMTVSKAYSMLESDGVLARRRGVGMVVSEATPTRQDRASLLRPALLAAADITRQLGIDDVEALAVFKSCLNEWTQHVPSDPE